MALVTEKWLLVIERTVLGNGILHFWGTADSRFHLECAELTAPPKGKWYCRDCKKIMERERRGGQNKKARVEGGKTSR